MMFPVVWFENPEKFGKKQFIGLPGGHIDLRSFTYTMLTILKSKKYVENRDIHPKLP